MPCIDGTMLTVQVKSLDLRCAIAKGIALKQGVTNVRHQNGSRALLAIHERVAQKWKATPANLDILIRGNASIALFVFFVFDFVVLEDLV